MAATGRAALPEAAALSGLSLQKEFELCKGERMSTNTADLLTSPVQPGIRQADFLLLFYLTPPCRLCVKKVWQHDSSLMGRGQEHDVYIPWRRCRAAETCAGVPDRHVSRRHGALPAQQPAMLAPAQPLSLCPSPPHHVRSHHTIMSFSLMTVQHFLAANTVVDSFSSFPRSLSTWSNNGAAGRYQDW